MIQNKRTAILMAKVKWLQQHPDKNKIGSQLKSGMMITSNLLDLHPLFH